MIRHLYRFICYALCTLFFSYSAFALDHLQIELGDEHPVAATEAPKHATPLPAVHCVYNKDIFNHLHLTQEQRSKIKTLQAQSEALLSSKHKELLTIHHQVALIIRKNTVDEPALDKLIAQKKEILATIMKNKALVKHEIYSLLSETQKIQYDQAINSLEEQHFENLAIDKTT